jgi:hypothetical protein
LNLYYKERNQLKTTLTQFGSTLPLTPDPPVRLHVDQKGRTIIKITIWRAFLPKTNYFCHPPTIYPPAVPAWRPHLISSQIGTGKNFPRDLHAQESSRDAMVAIAVIVITPSTSYMTPSSLRRVSRASCSYES